MSIYRANPSWLTHVAAVVVLCGAFAAHGQTGTWTPLTNAAPVFGNALLLTDGSVMVQQLQGSAWYRLTPDASGSYVNGTWSQLASMHDTRLYFASVVLKDGRVLVGGGEYGSGGKTVEIYDPVQNTWTYVNSWPSTSIEDSTAKVLPDGRVLLLPFFGGYWFYNPATDGWTFGTSPKSVNDEQSVAQLPDGSFFVPWDATSERYIPSSDQWVASATPPNGLIDSNDEIGPALLLYDGRVLCLGANGNTDIYTPPGAPTGLGTWVAGPVIPNGKNCGDAPAAVMPNGNVLIAADTGYQGGPTIIFEYDPVANSYTNVGGSANAGNVIRMLLLPSGQVLVCFGDSMQIYTPAGSPNAAWQPTVSSVAQNPDGSYTVTGTQLNGLTEGAYFGDDAQMSTNYPIVRLVSGNNVYYAKSYNFSSMGVATGNASVSADFIISGIPNGNYSLYVAANGVASNAVPFTFTDIAKPIITSLRTAAGTKNAAFSYSIKATGSPTSYNATGLPAGLTVNTVTGVISGTPTAAGTFNVTISAANASGTGSATLVLSVNAAPVITAAVTANPTTAEAGQPITFTVGASDPDGDTLLYSWANGTGGQTIYGYASATQTFSYASAGSFTVKVTVTDGHGQFVSSSVSVTITAGPSFTTVSPLPVGDVGAAYSQTFAASGGTPPYTWSAPFTAPPAGLTLSAAGVLSGTATTVGTTNFTVRLTDAVGAVVNKLFAVTINSAPSITTASLPNGTAGTAYSQTLAGTGGTIPYTWTVSAGALPAGLSLSSSGVLSGTPTTGGTSNFTVKLTDAAGGSATQSYTVTIIGGVSITTASPLPAGDVSTAYAQTFAASGGTAPYTWTVTSGAAPAGLTLTAAGVLSGTPTTAGASTFTIQATDSVGGTASKSFTVTVNAALAITTASPLPVGDAGTAYSQTFALSGGIAPFTWSVSAGALPAGLGLSAAGVLSGTPTAAGTSNFTVKVTDAAGAAPTAAFALTVVPANQSPVITAAASAVPNPGLVGQNIALSVSASDPNGDALTYSWTFGDGATGVGSSTTHAYAAAGTYSASVTVTDGRGGSAASSVSVVVNTNSSGGLVAYWKLDDGSGTTALDSSGNGNTGTVVDGPVWAAGKVGGCLQFDGVDDRVDIANVNHNVGTGDFTWTTWTYPRRLTNQWEGLVANGEYSPALYSKLYTAGQWGIYWGGDLPSGNTLTTGRWYHLAVIRQGGVIKFYQDGVQTSQTYAVSTSMANGAMHLGTSGVVAGARYGQADLDDVRIYNRALSGLEIAALANPTPAAPGITSTLSISATAGTAFSYTITASNSPTSFNATGLPTGLTVNTSTGLISGLPTTARAYSVTISATNSGGTGSATLALTVNSPAPLITSILSATATVGTVFSYTISASNSPTNYNATGLPAGLTVNTASGLISGTPTAAGTSSVALIATNANGTGTATLALTINAANQPPVITSAATATPNPATTGQSVTFTVSASDPNGDPLTYVWAFGDGGSGSGSSTTYVYAAAGTYTASVTVTDGKGGSAVSSVSVAVNTSLSGGLVAYWKLDDGSGTTALDSSGNGNTGAVVDGPVWAAGKVGGCLQFDGVDDRVDIANVNHNVGTGDFTWATWTYPRRLTNQWEGLVANGEYSPALYSKLYTAGQWGIYWGGDKPSGNTLTTGRWYHLAVIRQGGVIKFYQDGVQTSQTYAVSTSMANGAMHLGTSGVASGARYGQADLDEVRFYNRALSALEIAALAAPAITQPANATGTDAGTSFPLTVSKIQGVANFRVGGHDMAVVTGVIPNLPAGFDSAGQQLVLNIGGANVNFTLNTKGQGKSAQGSVALRLTPGKLNPSTNKLEFRGGDVAFNAKIMNGAWAALWKLDPAETSTNVPMAVMATIQLGGRTYGSTVSVMYSSKAGVCGKFKK